MTTGSTGLFEPGNGPSGSSPFYLNLVPDGITVAFTNGGTISQTVGTTTVRGDTYTLTVDVGFRTDLPDPGSVILDIGGVQTLAVGTPLQGSGNWSAYTASYTAPTAGEAIEIVLSSPSEQGDFDNVQLSAAPLPSAWTMLLIGLVGLGFLGYRQSTMSARLAVA